MSAARLTFLYPHLFRSIRASAEPLVSRSKTRYGELRTAPRRNYAAFPQRHGTAVEPEQAPLVDDSSHPTKTTPSEPPGPKDKPTPPSRAKESSSPPRENEDSPPPDAEEAPPAPDPGPPGAEPKDIKAPGPQHSEKASPMETVLHMGPPESVGGDGGAQQTMAEIQPPAPSMHHFDSYDLVNKLSGAGFTTEQSITVMKALRGILREKVESARETLVSKSDVDNETYLFRAACSELSTEVTKNRRAADEETREQRNRLQHEVDVLGQSLSQELLTLNDQVRGLFNDRKMAVREEQKANESAIQQINYKIGTILASDGKSDIEGLRWILIRRSVTGIAFMALVVLAALRYASYSKQQRKEEAEREKREAEERKRTAGMKDHSAAPDAAEILSAS